MLAGFISKFLTCIKPKILRNWIHQFPFLFLFALPKTGIDMSLSELMHRSFTVRRDSFADEDEESEGNYTQEWGNSSPPTGKGKKNTAAKKNHGSRNQKFSFLSRQGSIIGLPKAPDTRFNSHDIAARIKCQISQKCCKKPMFSFIPKEAVGSRSSSKGSRNSSFKGYDPGSPDVTCIGRIKLKKKEVKRFKTLTSARREDPLQTENRPRRNEKRSWLKKLLSLGRRKAEVAPALPDSGCIVSTQDEQSSRASGPQLKRFTSQREPVALSNLFFQEITVRGHQSAEDQSISETESNFSDGNENENENEKKLCHDSKAGRQMIKNMAESEQAEFSVSINVKTSCSPFDTDGIGGSVRTPPCEVNLWKRRSVAAPKALQLGTNPGGLYIRKPLTV